jgi:hypothetical protein
LSGESRLGMELRQLQTTRMPLTTHALLLVILSIVLLNLDPQDSPFYPDQHQPPVQTIDATHCPLTPVFLPLPFQGPTSTPALDNNL